METHQQLHTPEEELVYLRAQITEKEKELAALRDDPASREVLENERATITHETIAAHHAAQPETVLAPQYRITESEALERSLGLDPDNNDDTMDELRGIMEARGIKNALAVLDKLNNPHIADDLHRFLVRYIASGLQVQGLSEKAPRFKALHMTLYEVSLPEPKEDTTNNSKVKTLKELVSAMEQFYAGMLAVESAHAGEPPYIALELAVPLESASLFFYVSVPNGKRDLFEKQLSAIFPDASISPQPNDYNIFVEDGTSLVSTAHLGASVMLPLKDYSEFDYDPLNTILNAFAKIETEGEGAAIQIIFTPHGQQHIKHYRKVLAALRKGVKRNEAFRTPETTIGEITHDISKLFLNSNPKDKEKAREAEVRQIEANKNDIEQVERKLSTPIVGVALRIVVSASQSTRAEQVISDLEASFNQFDNTFGNRLVFERAPGRRARSYMEDFSFRIPGNTTTMPLSLRELTTIYHFPPKGIESSPHLKQSRFASAPAPMSLSRKGSQLGVNVYRGTDTDIFFDPADRLQHLYTIGQTGTGKTTLLKTLIAQDIRAGAGACFIDPHGNDIIDILAMIPPERYEDVIYFDPAYIERPFGLNMLEYDKNRPEQKTFIVNELLSIFKRLYSSSPESMGPAFEQYFRNATQLVMEDPESGSTMLDIPRVLANKSFRDMKLARSRNPVVNQFWEEIATQAQGEASLGNIVPYITNKFDEFTANDFIRPIIGQQESSFNIRDIMDNKKILLVNLSKGRLGERNANLLGLVLVGKIFMAALSRADTLGADFPPFYLYIDEFQNITTDSIPGILSEARKYKLSLNIAHQYLGQVDEKIRDAVFGNVGSMAVFRVGEEDAEFFAKQFAPVFTTTDFIGIENHNAYIKMLAHGVPQKPFNVKTLPPPEKNLAQADDLRNLSYLTYGRDRNAVEDFIRASYL